MKKILLPIALLILTVYSVDAQTFALEWDGHPYIEGDTITVAPELSSTAEILFEPIFYNNTVSGVNIEVARDEIIIVDGSVNYFCWDTCYLHAVDTSIKVKYIPAGSSTVLGDFVAHYEINETTGSSVIGYKFYDKSNPDENLSVFVKFDTSPSGVDDNIFNNIRISEIYPNPATNFVNIDYDIPIDATEANVRIVNMFGMVVKDRKLHASNNHMRLNVSELVEGIYFYSIYVNGKIFTTKKMIIR